MRQRTNANPTPGGFRAFNGEKMGKEAKIKAAAKTMRNPDTTTPAKMAAIYHLTPRNFRRLRARVHPPKSAIPGGLIEFRRD